MSFEKDFANLEKVAKKLEEEEVSLDDGIKLYEEGVGHLKNCIGKLGEQKGKLTVLKKQADKIIEEVENMADV